MTLTLSLPAALDAALDAGGEDLDALADRVPADRRDRFATLQTVYSLHLDPIDRLGERVRHQHHPAVAALKQRLEADWLAELPGTLDPGLRSPKEVVRALRALAAADRLPPLYRWVAREADWAELVRFLALEGGPDAGFDDLVAVCQVGLHGSAKLELATNYWDEMGDGDPSAVHTTLHERLVAAVGLAAVPAADQPVEALERTALGGLLATNRRLQPEMLGALGLTELQAGPRCRLVLQAFDRLGAPPDAYPFYEVHAEVDPRHGADWLDHAVVPAVAEHPEWGPRVVRGAVWRSHVNAAFFGRLAEVFAVAGRSAA